MVAATVLGTVVERRVGSSPIIGTYMVTIVQLVRTSDCGSEGRRFDSD